MKLSRYVSPRWRKHLNWPFWLFLGWLAAFVVLAHLALPRVKTAFAAAIGHASAAATVQPAVTAAVALERERGARAGELRRSVARLEALLAIAASPSSSSPAAAAVREMRQSLAALGTAAALQLAGDLARPEPDVRPVAAQLFRSALANYRERATLAREKAVADDLEQQFAAFLQLAESAGDFAARAGTAGQQLAAATAPLDRPATIPAIAWLPWTPWLITLAAAGAAMFGALAVAHTSRRIARPAAHLLEVARAIIHGRKRRASLEEAGELSLLAEALNQMIDARQLAEERLQAGHDSLELKVSARTAELWRANKTLREESEQRVRAERDFHQAQKMDALGKLAGSIAHDFNNLLTVIIGGAECVRKRLGEEHPVAPMLRTVEQAGERAAGLTRPLLTFSRNEILALEALNLNEAAQEAGRMLFRLLGVNVELRLELAPDLKPVKANANQIQQVLINFGVNARDAMNGMGVLTFTTRNTKVGREVTERLGIAAAEEWVELAVSDTGSGMDAATKARIFEPFFTTKPAGKGTGLGLATVFGIVRQSGGFMDVESELGNGTTFRVFLPATTVAQAAPAPEPAQLEMSAAPGTSDETVLLVDDEDDIRELATITLESCGYHVLSAPNAEEAIVLGEKHAGEIRALITDVTMPGMTGVQLAGVLTRIIPDLRVLFVSGHSNETISDDTLTTTNAEYLQKPFFGDALATKVRHVLSSARSRPVERVEELEACWMN